MMERIVYLDRSVLRTAVRRPAFEHEWIEYATESSRLGYWWPAAQCAPPAAREKDYAINNWSSLFN